jgi:hypothetical protein
MADVNLKVEVADNDGPSADTEMLFGGADQSAATPKPYTFAGIKTWIKSWSDALYLDAASNLADLADAGTGRSNLQVGYGSLQNRLYMFSDFLGGIYDFGFLPVSSGTGAGPAIIQVGALNALGILSLDLGTTTTGRTAVTANGATTPSSLKFGSGRCRFSAKCAIHTLSTGTETYTSRVGFLDSVSTEPTDGAYFRYTDSVNGGEWQAVTRSNGVETATDTNIAPVADTWHLMTIDVNAGGTSVVFAIDGSTVATNTTNIPTGSGRETGWGLMAQKSAGTTATSALYIDFAEVEVNLTSAR